MNIAAQADMRERLAQLGLEVEVNSPDEFVAVINANIAKWAKVIKDANIRKTASVAQQRRAEQLHRMSKPE